ncbi:MAG: TetR/AcrR family transcriptional regulator [Deltaproteobacteria bacterium]|nr:TetR/AcrR family transcriptional regulator [Deltaproteobacteria bacterium]
MTDSDRLRPRKLPRQTRSRNTVEAILAATSRVLVDEGYDSASTNRIAEVAGVSVGSLYQYFPNKQSLVVALLETHHQAMIGVLDEACIFERKASPAARLDVNARAYVEAVFAAHRVDPALHRILASHTRVLHDGATTAFEQRAEEHAFALVDGTSSSRGQADPRLISHMVRMTVQASAESSSTAKGTPLEQKALRNEVARLLVRYLEPK